MRISGVAIPLIAYASACILAFALVAFVPALGMQSWLGPLVVVAIVLIAAGFSVKWSIVQVTSARYEPIPASADNFPGLDRVSLDAQTAQLARIGFETVVDYGLNRTPPTTLGGFARLFYQPSTNVYAEANQVLRSGVPATAMAVSFISIFDEDWSMTTTTRRPTKHTAVQYALRRPKRRCQMVIGTSLESAYQRHLDAVRRLAEERALSTPTDDPADRYLRYLERQHEERQAAARRLNVIRFLHDIRRYSRSPKLEW